MSPALVVRGEALREAIDDRWRHPPLEARRRYGVDLRDVVLRFVPIGSDFDEGLQVLVAAGFTIKPRSGATTNRPAMQAAEIVSYSPCPFCGITAYVQLRAGPDEDWRRVGDVVGEIGIEWL